MAQGACRGRFVARTRVHDARMPLDDDDQWFYEHRDRMFRLRPPLPDDPAVPAGLCCCWVNSEYRDDRQRHGVRVLVARRPSGELVRLPMPTCRWHVPSPRDDRLLGKVYEIIKHYFVKQE
jgi:hypothetical protein